MLDLALSLIDRLIGLIREGQLRDRKLYDDFFVTFIGDMELLHQNYLDTFHRYRTNIQAVEGPLTSSHVLIEDIGRDILFTEQLRSRLRILWDYRSDPLFGELAAVAQAYLGDGEVGTATLLNGVPRLPNSARMKAILGLKQIFSMEAPDTQKISEALALLESIVGDLQQSFAFFLRAASATKRKLLDKRIRVRRNDA